MRLLFLNIYFHPDLTGTGKLLTELAEDLAERGHELRVVTSRPHYGRDPGREPGRDPSRDPAAPSGPPAREGLRKELHGKVAVWRTRVWVPRRVTFISRVVNYLSFTALSFVAGLRAGPCDVVVSTWPLTVGFSAFLLARLRGARFVLNIQDIVPRGLLRNPIAALGNWVSEKALCRLADRIFVLSQGMADVLVAKGVAPDKIRVVPNWIDLDEIRPAPRDEAFREEQGLSPADFLVVSSGNIGQLGGLDCVLEAMSLLRTVRRLKLLIVGGGNHRRRLMERAEELGLAEVRFLDALPRERFPALLAAADLCLVARDARFAGHNVPSRAYAFLAAGRPILAVLHEDNEISRVALEERCGWWAPQDDPLALASELRLAMTLPAAELQEMGRRGRAFVEREHGRDALTRRWEELLAESCASS